MSNPYWDKPKTAKDSPQQAKDRYGLPVVVSEREDPKKAKVVDAILALMNQELKNEPSFKSISTRERKNPNRKK